MKKNVLSIVLIVLIGLVFLAVGTLTATEKRVIKSMIEQNIFEGSVRKVNYFMSLS